ncbi:uncharacterized protein UV8b_02965 [Ustilaginoidea virens]|uniref:Fungal lipase-type domain-containing protein n=1 Tax=Ustilaginoidea virens TaxID=1159556 RepID=A0A8E5HNG7_USTVR|nr:uncharacterized protein UV8b_02965 [Ustilaginoidea virens]QUC18724.1 hypothetical protein UV8b_02965 [Ustilaginoidea virens]
MKPASLSSFLVQVLFAWQSAHSQSPLGSDSESPSTRYGLVPDPSITVSTPLFSDLERLARLVDISYCIGNTGVHKPFDCLSRCKEFPRLVLKTTWSTGMLLGDSCGYIALDRGNREAGDSDKLRPVSRETEDGAIVVAFRGTYSIANAVADLSMAPQEYMPYPAPGDDNEDHPGGKETSPGTKHHRCDNCTVHMGFWQSWQSARKTVLPELKALRTKHPTHRIQLVGHSLGGAVACLAALELKLSLGWDNVVATTFGEPRVGNYQLSRFIDWAFDLDGTSGLEQRSYRRVTHNGDPVPMLPLEEWGYRPHGGEIYISKRELQPAEEDVRVCVGDSDPSCSAGLQVPLLEDVRRLFRFVPSSTSTQQFVAAGAKSLPTRFKLWQLFFAHRDYFWRLGLCVPGGDPANWGRGRFDQEEFYEL